MPDLNKAEITVDEVIEAYGEHYINEGQNLSNLHLLPYESYGTQSAGTIIETDQTVLRDANVEVQEILQQYQDDFTSKGGLAVMPVETFLYNVKIDIAFVPHSLIKSWMGFLTNNDRTPENYPFVTWVVEQYLLKQQDEDLEMKAIYKGKYEAPVAGVAGSADKVMNGLEFLLNQLISSGDTIPFELGDLDSLSAKDFVTKIEEYFVKQIPEKYRHNIALELNMNRTYRDKFKQGMRDKYNINYQQTGQLTTMMDFENINVVGRASMMGKKRIWTTPKFNLLLPVKGFSVESCQTDHFNVLKGVRIFWIKLTIVFW